LIVIKSDCKRGVNKSNHPVQNPLFLVTEPWTHANIVKDLCASDNNCKVMKLMRKMSKVLYERIWRNSKMSPTMIQEYFDMPPEYNEDMMKSCARSF
jgi:hypothetical protein